MIENIMTFGRDSVVNAIKESNFEIKHNEPRPARNPKLEDFKDLGLSSQSLNFWEEKGYSKMYSHQRKAIKESLDGNNICISTSTSSGKTEIFQTVAMEILAKNKEARVLAVYSAKALNRQQTERWKKTGYNIGTIDGDTSFQDRIKYLKECQILVMTPDVVHAFLLGKVKEEGFGRDIKYFIKNIELVIIDEIHLYRGVFGTNSAYMFRRLNNLRRIYRNDLSFPLYITASATLPNPAQHSQEITGASDFINIGMEDDGSPSSPTTFYYIEKSDQDGSFSDSVSRLIAKVSKLEGVKSITFVNGRQQTGDYAFKIEEETAIDNYIEDEVKGKKEEENIEKLIDQLKEYQVYPFKAGGEKAAREKIMVAMENKEFNGIISTSALEIGIDVAGLNICILANLPQDRNSYYQRIGRVGRGGIENNSMVIIVNDGSVNANILFNNGFQIDNVLPDLEPALHMESERIVNTQLCCHTDIDQGYAEIEKKDSINKSMEKYFPAHFCEMARKISIGSLPDSYKNLVDQLEKDPHYAYPIRNMGRNYEIIEDDASERYDTITRKQLFQEGYKNAVRNTIRINSEGEVEKYRQKILGHPISRRKIRAEESYDKYLKTRPNYRTYVVPNLTNGSVMKVIEYGSSIIINSDLREIMTAYGYYKIRGNNKKYEGYENPYRSPMFSSGILIFNPEIFVPDVKTGKIAEMLYNAFLTKKAFDKGDINGSAGKLLAPSPIRELQLLRNDKFIAIYDSNDLNISGSLINDLILKEIFSFLKDNINRFSETLFKEPLNEETIRATTDLCNSILDNEPRSLRIEEIPDTIDIFETFSQAEYEMVDENTGEINYVPCLVCGFKKDANEKNHVTYDIILLESGEQRPNIDMEMIRANDDSLFVKFDWKSGSVIQ